MIGFYGKESCLKNMDGKKENLHFYFPVYGYIDGNEIKFGVDPEVEFVQGYIYNIDDQTWSMPLTKELLDLDSLILSHLISRIGNVSLSLEDK